MIGLEETIILGELASEFDYWEKQGSLEDGYFYSTVENVQNNTTLSDHKQRKALKSLQDRGLIDVKLKGIPAKRYIKINELLVFNLFNEQLLNYSNASSQNFKELDVKNLKGNNNITNKNINNKINNKKESKKESFDSLIDNYTANEDLRTELKNHLATRKAKKATLTNRAIELSLKKLDELTKQYPVNMQDDAKIKIVQKSIENGWIGFFELKDNNYTYQQNNGFKTQNKASGWEYINEEFEKVRNNIF
jgi:hypothetical protein